MTSRAEPPLALITGACGGMGIACARVFSRRHRLLLTDLDAARLAALAEELRRDAGEAPAVVAGDIAAPELAGRLAEAAAGQGGLDVLVHTAGLSPALAGWEAIVEVNLAATVRLLDALEPQLAPGAAAVLLASMAGHLFASSPEIDAVLDTADEPGLAQRLEPHLRAQPGANGPYGLAQPAYGASKYAVARLCEQRAIAWAQRGARIVSLSPGLIATPMGLKEAAENPAAGSLVAATPAGRWGTPLDIASAAEFLASDLAGFITGCDLRIDGGLTAALRHGRPG